MSLLLRFALIAILSLLFIFYFSNAVPFVSIAYSTSISLGDFAEKHISRIQFGPENVNVFVESSSGPIFEATLRKGDERGNSNGSCHTADEQKQFWRLCNPSQAYKAKINKFDLIGAGGSTVPRGKPIEVALEGTLEEQVGEGTWAEITVQYRHIQLLQASFDVCEELEGFPDQNELKCPIQKGPVSTRQKVDIPKDIPKGRYDIKVKGLDQKKKELICIIMSIDVV